MTMQTTKYYSNPVALITVLHVIITALQVFNKISTLGHKICALIDIAYISRTI